MKAQLHSGSPIKDPWGHVLKVCVTVQEQNQDPGSFLPIWGLTSNSMWSCSFLQVAAKVSVVPNSKYHNLFFILDHEVDKRHGSIFCI